MGELEDRSSVRNVWMSIVMTLSIIGNVLLILVITRNGRFHNVTNAYNLTLSVSDLVKVVSFIPLYLVYADLKTWPFGDAGCVAFNVVFYTSFGMSVMVLMCLSYERYHLIALPCRKQMTIRQALKLIMVTCLVSLLFSCLLTPFHQVIENKFGLRCTIKTTKTWYLAIVISMTILSQLVPGTFFLIIHIMTVRKLRRDAGAVELRNQSLAARNRFKRNSRAIRILVIEAISWIISIIPFLAFTFIQVVKDGKSVKPFSWEFLIVNCALVLQTVVNPALHFIVIREFRNELRRMWNAALKKLQVNQVEPNKNTADNEVTEFAVHESTT